MIRKKALLILTFLLVLIEFSFLFLMYKSFANKNIESNQESLANTLGIFAIMIEDENGNFSKYNGSEWPTEEYIYNSLRSGCLDDNGNIIENSLLFDEVSKIAKVTIDKPSKCYLYFEKNS